MTVEKFIFSYSLCICNHATQCKAGYVVEFLSHFGFFGSSNLEAQDIGNHYPSWALDVTNDDISPRPLSRWRLIKFF